MKFVKTLFLVLALSLAAGCAPKAIMTPEINVGTHYAGLSSQDVKTAIIEACTGRGWKIDSQTDTQVDASITVRGKHFVAVRIPYSAQSVKIEYKDSSNMRYTPGETPKIHRNYNNWVDYLKRDIHAKLTSISNSRISK